MSILLASAIFPIVVLCYYIYLKDINKEPSSLLAKIFILGFFSAIPVVIVEVVLSDFFQSDSGSFLSIFISTFISVALVEEGFKWFITKLVGYNNKEFDEIYDIIVYAVFASLGFACIENILYVFQNGLGNAILRALISVPGHTCFAVLMGYFFSEAKIASVNQNNGIYRKNICYSILVPTVAHTLFDAIIFYASYINSLLFVLVFFIFYIIMVVCCFKMVNKVSKLQHNISTKLSDGSISNNGNGQIVFNSTISEFNFCPICGNNVEGCHYCPSCGFHLETTQKSS